MSVKDLLTSLNLEPKTEGSQLVVACPACGKVRHCYINSVTGLWHCKVCAVSGNPYQLIKYFKPALEPKDIFATLERYGLDSDTQAEKQPERAKDLSWLKNELRKPSEAEIDRLCKAKGVSAKALLAFNPWMDKVKPIMYLPAYTPGHKNAVGFLRVHINGKLIKTRNGEQKYPILGNWGLLGLKAAEKAETILFAEGWRDALAAIEAGYTAIANIGGTGFKNEWLPLFKSKVVIIVPDSDEPGVKAAYERAEKIAPVAKKVVLTQLPQKIVDKSGLDLYDFLSGVKE